MTRYGLVGSTSGELLTYGGRVLVHPVQAELQWLFPATRVVVVPSSIPPEQTLPLCAHPELAGVRFPLDRRDFRR